MRIEDVHVNNWEPPGSVWWNARENAPDEQSLDITMRFKMSFNEYKELVKRHEDENRVCCETR